MLANPLHLVELIMFNPLAITILFGIGMILLGIGIIGRTEGLATLIPYGAVFCAGPMLTMLFQALSEIDHNVLHRFASLLWPSMIGVAVGLMIVSSVSTIRRNGRASD